jgi:hypothetical protein
MLSFKNILLLFASDSLVIVIPQQCSPTFQYTLNCIVKSSFTFTVWTQNVTVNVTDGAPAGRKEAHLYILYNPGRLYAGVSVKVGVIVRVIVFVTVKVGVLVIVEVCVMVLVCVSVAVFVGVGVGLAAADHKEERKGQSDKKYPANLLFHDSLPLQTEQVDYHSMSPYLFRNYFST